MKIAVTTDHAGFEALNDVKEFLKRLGHEVVDFGPQTLDPNDDYPDFMFPAAQAVARGDCERAIIMGMSGTGEAIAANRIKGVRCALFYGPAVAKNKTGVEELNPDPYQIVRLSRLHNDANVLSLSGMFLDQQEIHTAIEVWLSTEFSGAERHIRRIRKLDEAS